MKPRAALAAFTAAAAMPLAGTPMATAAVAPPVRTVIPQPAAVNFVRGPYPGVDIGVGGGVAAADVANSTVYSQQPLDAVQRAHEVGHIFDAQDVSEGDRLRFEQIAGFGKGRWNMGTGLTTGGLKSPNEYFADWYANAAAGNNPGGPKGGSWESGYATPPSQHQFDQFKRLLAQIGARRGLQPYQR